MNRDYDKVFEVLLTFSVERDYYRLLEAILGKMMDISGADGGTLYVSEDGFLYPRIMRNVSMNIYQSEKDPLGMKPVPLNEENTQYVSAYCALNNKTVIIDDIYDNGDRFNFQGPINFDKANRYRTKSMLVMPLTATAENKNEVIGVIQLINAMDDYGGITPFYNVYTPPILPALANISANTLANIKYSKEVKELFNSFVRVMTSAIDERSHYNSSHTNNVALYCARFADYLNTLYPPEHPYHFTQERREKLMLAALLHDIGKIITPLEVMDKGTRLDARYEGVMLKLGLRSAQLQRDFLQGGLSKEAYEAKNQEVQEAVRLIDESNAAGFLPDEIIAQLSRLASLTYEDTAGESRRILTDDDMESLTVQRGTLTAAERRIMQQHVSITERLLEQISFGSSYNDVVRWAGAHHEFQDGSGYPKGITGDKIPLEAAILTIADIYDAMVADDRPYKRAIPIPKALSILQGMAEEGKLHRELTALFLQSGTAVHA